LILLADYRPPAFLVETVDLTFQLSADATIVDATTRYRPNPAHPVKTPALVLDGEDLTLIEIKLNGKTLATTDYNLSSTGLTLANPPRKTFALSIRSRLNPAANTRLMGLYRSNGIYCTQCEADGFRRISYFQDRPDVMGRYRVRIEADKAEAPILLSNGNLQKAGMLSGGRHFAVWDDPHPKPCYLFALVAGDLDAVKDSLTTMEKRKVELAVYVEKGKAPLAGYAMGALKRSMIWDEKAYGRAYDLDVFNIVAVSDFNMGAMENKGLNVFNDKYVLASPETATDTDYLLIEAIIGHEYFHNWTGNRITCRDWFQLCLKEGLTVFRDQEFTADLRSRAVKRISDVRELKARQFPEDGGPLSHPVRPTAYKEVNNFYTATVYEKGAEIIRMLKLLIGPAAFRKGMDLYFNRHDGEACTIEQFIACFAETSGRDLTHFALWYHQSGTPEVSVRRLQGPGVTLELSQKTGPTPGQPTKTPFVIPIKIGLVDTKAKTAPRSKVVLLDEAQKTIRFPKAAKGSVPSLLQGFSAPVRLTTDLTETELAVLAAKDMDPVNRWQSLQTILMRTLTEASRDQKSLTEERLDRIATSMRQAITNGQRDPAFAALCLGLPGVSEIAQDLATNVDHAAIHAARKQVKAEVATKISNAVIAALSELPADKKFAPTARAAGKRALQNALLDWALSAKRITPAGMLARVQSANNMTDRVTALVSLVQHAPFAIATDAAIAFFEQRHGDNPLVMDKWFAVQAGLPDPDALDRVRQLLKHPSFSLSNPNRCRSLIGGFALSNPIGFNRPDGAGYRFVTEQAVTIDAINPQVSARILTAFRSWRALEPKTRKLAEGALKALGNKPNLSRDLSDIVERTLG
jgi:aminopeptidase N